MHLASARRGCPTSHEPTYTTVAAAALWYLVVFGSYGSVEKIFIVMTLVFFA
jgi:hypothetical protein